MKEVFKGSGGDASASAMRIQFIYEYLSGKVYIEIGDARCGDSPSLYNIIKDNKLDVCGNALFLSDLGYFKTDTFNLIDQDLNCFFISKLKFNTQICDINDQKIDLGEMVKDKPQKLDLEIKIGGMKCRLLGSRLPDDVVNERRRKARKNAKRKGRSISRKYQISLEYALFITNLPVEYTHEIIYTIYRIRWQIELIFKTWKSVLKIHKIHSARLSRVLCEVYGKLLVAILLSSIHHRIKLYTGINISYYKTVQYFQPIALKWAMKIFQGFNAHEDFLGRLLTQIARFCKKTKQKNKPTIEELLMNLQPEINHSFEFGHAKCA